MYEGGELVKVSNSGNKSNTLDKNNAANYQVAFRCLYRI